MLKNTFFQYFKDVTPLSSSLHSFQEVSSNFYLCSLVLKFPPTPASSLSSVFSFIFHFQQFNYKVSGVFLKTLLGVLWDSWICCLFFINFRKFSAVIFSCISSSLSSLFSFRNSNYTYIRWLVSMCCLRALICTVWFCLLFSFCVSFRSSLLAYL